MPIYEYRCSQCGHELEALQRLSEAPLVNCPACGKDALTKLVSAAGFQLKGSGWYATDFRGSGSGKKKDADKPAAEAKADTAKPDAPAAKSESTSASTTTSTSPDSTKAA
jgi:putative FmdB family regulatory protein